MSRAPAAIDASSSAEASSFFLDSSAASISLRAVLTVFPTVARISAAIWPIERKYPVSEPDFPTTPTRIFSRASVFAAPEIATSVSL